MTRQRSFRIFRRISLFLSVPLLLPFVGSPQITLTGASDFGTSATGATNVQQAYEYGFNNTIGGDQWWNLWMALDPNASLPINGPADSQAGIAIPLMAGHSYKYYVFASGVPGYGTGYVGWNLFFDGSVSTPNISVFGPVASLNAVPNSSDVLSLAGDPAPGSGSSFYAADGVIALLTEVIWDGLQTPPGNVAQPFVFSPNPDGDPSSYGSFTVRVFPAAALNTAQPSGPPASKLSLTGSGFVAGESVGIYANRISVSPIAVATAGSDGTFSETVREPQQPYGTLELFALGLSSGDLGATKIAVTAGVAASPESVEPGGTVAAEGLGFGAGETVSVYLDNPRELLGTATANTLGSFVGAEALPVAIPANASTGLNALVAIGSTTGAIGIGKLIVK
jgi:hypothetical protein